MCKKPSRVIDLSIITASKTAFFSVKTNQSIDENAFLGSVNNLDTNLHWHNLKSAKLARAMPDIIQL